MNNQKSSKRPILVIIIVALVVLSIPCLGIVAAVAIPAFTRYIKASKTSEASGMTREIADAAAMHFREQCEFPPSIPMHTDIQTCCGGEKCVGSDEPVQAFQEMGVSLSEPTYFGYETERVPGANPGYVVRAKADFSCDPPAHTLEIELRGTKSGGNCTVEQSPPVTLNEFE